MKLTIALLLFFTFQASANDGYAQKITIVKTNVHLTEIFRSIEQQTGYHFFYDRNLIKNTHPIDISIRSATLDQALTACLSGQGLTYSVVKNTVVIRAEMKAAFLQTQAILTEVEMPEAPPVEIHGRVVNQQGEPLQNVSVLIAGTKIGTTTDSDGRFSITSPDNRNVTLEVSSVGFQTKKVNVGNQREVNVVLEVANTGLSEVVVTALGRKESVRALTSATQSVNPDLVKDAKELNVTSSLEGRVAGLAINSSSTGLGAEDRVVLRGNRSINGNSQPLYVIDGVPTQGGISTISSDNIASINVLKGANAAALYGSSAQNGVIIITTKSGQKGIKSISLNSNFMARQPIVTPQYQNLYGQGQGGLYDKTSEFSWGPKMEGQTVDAWSINPDVAGKTYAMTPQPDNVRDLYQTGYNMSHNLIANIGGESSQGLISYTFTDGRDVIPNNKLERHNVDLRVSNKLTNNLTWDTKLTYIYQNITDGWFGGHRYNPTQYITQIPRNIQTQQLKDFEFINSQGNLIQNYFSPGSATGGNPYWILNRTPNSTERQRVLGLTALNYKFSDHFDLMARIAFDGSNSKYQEKLYFNNYADAPSGRYSVTKTQDWLINSDFLFTYKNKFGENFNFESSIGGELRKSGGSSLSSNTGKAMVVENFFTLANTITPLTSYFPGNNLIKQSIYGLVNLDWKKKIYFNVTGRNDWSSTLPSDNWSYFYPSVGVGVILSDIVHFPEFISFVKLASSNAWVGNDAPPYMLQRTATFSAGGQNGFVKVSSIIPNSQLLPERTKSFEQSLDLGFLQNRITLNIIHYRTNTANQLFSIQLPVGSGAASFFTNGGDIQNQGFESVLSYKVITNHSFRWSIDINHSANKNIVKRISDERPLINMTPNGFVSNFIIKEGEPFGMVYSRGFLRDDQGRVIVGSNGLPKVTAGLTVPIGNFNPNWTGSIGNTFTYKGVSLNFLITHRQGGAIVSGTKAIMDGAGLTERTLAGRDGSLIFGENVFINENAVREDGSKNTIAISAESFWRGIGGRNAPIGEAFVESATNTRLRQLSIGYSLPEKMIDKLSIKSLRISLVGRNLFFITRSAKDLDPDFLNGIDPTSEGTQQFTPITTRSWGININVDF